MSGICHARFDWFLTPAENQSRNLIGLHHCDVVVVKCKYRLQTIWQTKLFSVEMKYHYYHEGVLRISTWEKCYCYKVRPDTFNIYLTYYILSKFKQNRRSLFWFEWACEIWISWKMYLLYCVYIFMLLKHTQPLSTKILHFFQVNVAEVILGTFLDQHFSPMNLSASVLSI